MHIQHLYKKNRILVVDDEEFCLSSLKAIMSRTNLNVKSQVDFVISAEEALFMVENLARIGFMYKLIITDFNMPETDGIQLTKQIRQLIPQLKIDGLPYSQPSIVGLTGHAVSKFCHLGIESGMDEVISKPMYVDKLKRVLE